MPAVVDDAGASDHKKLVSEAKLLICGAGTCNAEGGTCNGESLHLNENLGVMTYQLQEKRVPLEIYALIFLMPMEMKLKSHQKLANT
jgi:hypothetical protein